MLKEMLLSEQQLKLRRNIAIRSELLKYIASIAIDWRKVCKAGDELQKNVQNDF